MARNSEVNHYYRNSENKRVPISEEEFNRRLGEGKRLEELQKKSILDKARQTMPGSFSH
jgi:hypothetical protein